MQLFTLAKGMGYSLYCLSTQKSLINVTDTKKKTKLAIPKMLNERKTTAFIPFGKSKDFFHLYLVKTTFKLTLSMSDIWFTHTQYKKMNSKQGDYITNAFQNIWCPPNKSISLEKDTTTLCNTYL